MIYRELEHFYDTETKRLERREKVNGLRKKTYADDRAGLRIVYYYIEAYL